MSLFSLPVDVDQFLGSTKTVLGGLLQRYSGAEITDKLNGSILAMATRQMVHSHCFYHCGKTPLPLITYWVLCHSFNSQFCESGHVVVTQWFVKSTCCMSGLYVLPKLS